MKLHVRVVEATDVPKMDFFGKADPYCLLTLGNSSIVQKTKVCSNTYDPVWNQEFHFDVHSQATDKLYISMKDRDRGMVDDPISKMEISLATLVIGNVYDKWYDMDPYKGVKKGGRIRLVLHLAAATAIPFQQINPMMNSMYAGSPVMMQPPMYSGYGQPQMNPYPYGMQPGYGAPSMGQPVMQPPMMGQPMMQPALMGQPMMQQPPMIHQPMMGQPMVQPGMMGQPMYQPQPMMHQPMMGQPSMMGQPMMGQPMYPGQTMMGRPY